MPADALALTDGVEAAIREACTRAIMPRFRHLGEGEVIEKAADDLVTIADRESEDILTERLGALLPEAAIVGEEAAHADPTVLDRLGDGLCWIIDPIDGTHNFAHGRWPFGVLIALADGGDTIGGWLFDPLQNRLCHAAHGGGAFVNRQPFTARTTGENPPVAGISTMFLDDAERDRVMARVAPNYRLVDIPRCAAEQYPRLALGENDVALFGRVLPWDHAAGVLWLNEAGGKAARPDGQPYRADGWKEPRLVAASSPQLWEAFAARLS